MNQPTQPNGSAYALELLDISVHYGGVVVLDGADIGVREGEVRVRKRFARHSRACARRALTLALSHERGAAVPVFTGMTLTAIHA